jgi:hypothetical protein
MQRTEFERIMPWKAELLGLVVAAPLLMALAAFTVPSRATAQPHAEPANQPAALVPSRDFAEARFVSPSLPTDYAILQGVTSEAETAISIVAPKSDSVSVSVRGDDGVEVQPKLTRTSRAHSDFEVVRIDLSRLKPELAYTLQVVDQKGHVRDQRTFQTLRSSASPIRFAVGSCMDDHLHNPWIWQTIESRKPDLVLLTGDTVYLDHVSLLKWKKDITSEQIWDRHVDARNRLGLYRWRHLRPTLAVFDDHDFAFNNAQARNAPLADESRAVLTTFFPRKEIRGTFESGPGLSFHFSHKGLDLLVLDGRSFRDHLQPHAFFGQAQEAWLERRLSGPTAPKSAFLVTGSQFFGAYLKKDSYEYHAPSDLSRFARVLSASPTRLTFLSGDIHFSEVMKIESKWLGYPTLEATVSSLHSGTVPGRHKLDEWRGVRNPRRLGATSTHNFAEITAQARADFTDLQIDLVTWRNQVKFQAQMTHQHRSSGWACLQQLSARAP